MTVKKKVTREDVLKSIISLINEHRENIVEESACLGQLHISIPMLRWLFDWLKEEYSMVGMTIPDEDELSKLLKGDTIGKLADIAINHIQGDGEYEIQSEELGEYPHEEVKRSVAIRMSSGACQSYFGPKDLTKEEFLKMCGEFFDARGTHVNDYEFMAVRLNEEEKEDVK